MAAGPDTTIAIIGAGFSGTMTAVHLRRLLPQATILLCEARDRFARGLAYTSPTATHLLNVRAANMSAFPDDAAHFQRWIDENAPQSELSPSEAGVFATRRLYGDYLAALLANTAQLQRVGAEITGVSPDGDEWALHTQGGSLLHAQVVVIATGNLLPATPPGPAVFRDPWCASAVEGLRPDAPVLIVGTGLTMVDLALEMHSRGFPGPIVALSRRGKLPQSHTPSQAWPTPEIDAATRASALRLLRRVRAEIAAAAARGIGWRGVIDSLRPLTAGLWQSLPAPERARFLRHVRPYWDIHRHRLAPAAAAALSSLLAGGQLRVHAGRLLATSPDASGATITWRPRGRAPETLRVQRVIHAIGTAATADVAGLAGQLRAQGLARLDPSGLGLDVSPGLNLLTPEGTPNPNLFALGPAVRGVFWECTAVPDIRLQARDVAQSIAAFLAPRHPRRPA